MTPNNNTLAKVKPNKLNEEGLQQKNCFGMVNGKKTGLGRRKPGFMSAQQRMIVSSA